MTVKIYSQEKDSYASIEITPIVDENGNNTIMLFAEDGRLGGDYVSVQFDPSDFSDLCKFLNELVNQD
jgi:hypothetical protein